MSDAVSIHLRVRFFAILKDRAGVPQSSLAVPVGASVGHALRELAAQFPAIEPLLPNTATAVNRAYVRREHVLLEGDELALIPPVSGG
jgi:molybdopterin converting factor subunit 1